MAEENQIKLDLHIHTLDDTKDALDYSAHQLLERAQRLGFAALAITLHDSVFDRREVFEDAAAMGILLIQAAEMRLHGADIVLLNITPAEAAGLRDFDDVRRLRAERGPSLFTFAPHPFYLLGGSIGGERLAENIDCFDAIEICHFHKGWFDRNRPARAAAARFGKPLLATSDAHQLSAFGSHYTSIPRPPELTPVSVFAALREGDGRLTSPPCTLADLVSTLHFIFVLHPLRKRGWLPEPQRHAPELKRRS
ncbi:MAG: PHP-associated domain-containing protein [Chthoniobacterales bacterium]